MHDILKRIYEIPGGGSRFRSMEGLRAYAALLVFFVHYFDAYIRDVFGQDPNGLTLSQISDPGLLVSFHLFASHYGVDIFFFLSGFLVCRMLARPDFELRSFLSHRVMRIYPAAVIALCAWAFLRINIQGWYPFDGQQFTGNLLFLNALPELGIKPYATITWSLFYELLFYLTFPLILLVTGADRRITPLKVILFALVYMWGIMYLGGMFIRFWMFFAGAFMAALSTEHLQRLSTRVPTWFVVAAFLGSTLLFSETLRYDYFIPVFVFTTFFFVVNVLFGGGLLYRIFSITPLRYLGNISFSFYLVHGFAIEIIMYNKPAIFDDLEGTLYLVATLLPSLALSVLFATVLFVLAERPYFYLKPKTRQDVLVARKQPAG
jgi:peptidoglycan/LPS O-acetylase OafA/YrhL